MQVLKQWQKTTEKKQVEGERSALPLTLSGVQAGVLPFQTTEFNIHTL